jgi:hypothetical protein
MFPIVIFLIPVLKAQLISKMEGKMRIKAFKALVIFLAPLGSERFEILKIKQS